MFEINSTKVSTFSHGKQSCQIIEFQRNANKITRRTLSNLLKLSVSRSSTYYMLQYAFYYSEVNSNATGKHSAANKYNFHRCAVHCNRCFEATLKSIGIYDCT